MKREWKIEYSQIKSGVQKTNKSNASKELGFPNKNSYSIFFNVGLHFKSSPILPQIFRTGPIQVTSVENYHWKPNHAHLYSSTNLIYWTITLEESRRNLDHSFWSEWLVYWRLVSKWVLARQKLLDKFESCIFKPMVQIYNSTREWSPSLYRGWILWRWILGSSRLTF